MVSLVKAAASACVLLASQQVVQAAVDADEVTSLPGWGDHLPSKQYSGYLDIGSGKMLHYYLVASESNPDSAPLVWWFNGGPGCSSMGGFTTELGPFLINDDLSLSVNPGRFNQYANMVFLESPAGAGFSYAADEAGYTYNDDTSADDNYLAVKKFLSLYPEYAGREMYITGESYAGIYVPMLAHAILVNSDNDDINLQGFMVGNGCIGTDVGGCGAQSNEIDMEFAAAHSLISKELYASITETCDWDDPNLQCLLLVQQANQMIGPVDIYNILFPCASNSDGKRKAPSSQVNHAPLSLLERLSTATAGPQACFVDDDPATKYLNSPDVRSAIHVPTIQAIGEWRVCGERVGGNYTFRYTKNEPDLTRSVYPDLAAAYRILIFNGDQDLCVPHVGNEKWTSEFGATLSGTKDDWRAWEVNNQVAGYVTSYGGGSFSFATVKGAGHMVPQFQPVNAVEMFRRFINEEPL